MQIILRDKKVKTLVVEKSLSQTEVDKYKPTHFAIANPIKVVFGFNSRNKNHYGIMMYHRNRLIKPYERVGYQLKANNLGVGVVGVVQCDFLQPTHNKQDFDYTKAYRACIYSLGIKLNEYWNEKKGPARSQNNNLVDLPIPEPNEIHALPDQNWVQCDRPSCLKWRKIPDGIDPDSLPDKWYCENNPDPQFKSCDVPEEKEEEATNITPYQKTQKKRLVKEMEEKQKREKAEKLAAQREQEEMRKQLEKQAEDLKKKDEEIKKKEKQITQLQEIKPKIKVEGGSLPTAQVAPRPTLKLLNAVTPTAKTSTRPRDVGIGQVASRLAQAKQSTPSTPQINQSASTTAKPSLSPARSIPSARSNQSTPSPTLGNQTTPKSSLVNQSTRSTNTTIQSPSNKPAIQPSKPPTNTNLTPLQPKPSNASPQTIKLVTPSQAQKLGTAGITFKMVKAPNGSTYLVQEKKPQENVTNTGIKPGKTVVRASGPALTAAVAALGAKSTPGTSSSQPKATNLIPVRTSSSSTNVDVKPRLNVLPNPQLSARPSVGDTSTNDRVQNVVTTAVAANQQNASLTPTGAKTVARSLSKTGVKPSHSMAATAYSEITGNTSTTPQDVKNILTSGIKREPPENLVSPIPAKIQRKKSDAAVIVIDPLPSETKNQKQLDLAAENHVKELERRVKELESRAKENESRAKNHENRAKEYESRAKKLESSLAEAKSDAKDKIDKMAIQLDEKSMQLTKRNKEMEEKTKEIRSKESELKDKIRQLKVLRGNVCKLLQVLVPEIDVESEGDGETVDDLLRQVLEANK